MASVHERIAGLAKEFLDHDEVNFERSFADADVSSMDAIAFAKSVANEFSCEIPPEVFASIKNLNDLVTYVTLASRDIDD